MTYFGFLGLFLLIPIAMFGWLNYRDAQRGRPLVASMRGLQPYPLIGILVLIAFTWTTPWDNYLVATSVWWYDLDLVSGIVLWYVPIEEYCFFVLQPIMTGLFTVWLMRRLPAPRVQADTGTALRRVSTAAALVLMLAAWVVLLFGPRQANYLTLELIWALPPIALQLAFGADILLRHWRLVAVAIGLPTIYLSIADAIAIQSGTWTIDPEQSFCQLMLFGVLPLEELLFFTITNVLLVFGLVLGSSTVGAMRLPAGARPWLEQRAPRLFQRLPEAPGSPGAPVSAKA
jgi:lycopene beta-cyclase